MSPSPGAPTPRDLNGATAVARTLAYAVGVAGIVSAAAWQQTGGSAVVTAAIVVFTVAVAALLMVGAFLLQAMTAVMARLAAVESDLRVLMGRGSPGDRLGVEDRDERW